MRRFVARSQLNGLQATVRGFDKVKKLHMARVIQGSITMTAMIFIRSQAYCPVDTGQLKASGDYGVDYGGFVAMRSSFEMYSLMSSRFKQAAGATFIIQYSAPYAIFVHEEQSHLHAFPTGAKFLERAAEEVIAENDNHIPWNDVLTFGFEDVVPF